jgi:VDE lipocalin domain
MLELLLVLLQPLHAAQCAAASPRKFFVCDWRNRKFFCALSRFAVQRVNVAGALQGTSVLRCHETRWEHQSVVHLSALSIRVEVLDIFAVMRWSCAALLLALALVDGFLLPMHSRVAPHRAAQLHMRLPGPHDPSSSSSRSGATALDSVTRSTAALLCGIMLGASAILGSGAPSNAATAVEAPPAAIACVVSSATSSEAAAATYDGFADYAAKGKKMDESDVGCFAKECGKQTKDCFTDGSCLKGVTCLGRCKGEQVSNRAANRVLP